MTPATPPLAVDESNQRMVQLIREIAHSLCDSPDQVSVECLAEADNTVIRLHVAPTDIGKVIGRQGRTARSLRTILGGAGMKLRHRYTLDIVEEA